MSERGLLLGIKCPQICVEEILQNRQFHLNWPHFKPQIKLLCLISALKWGFESSFLNVYLKIDQNHHTNLQSRQKCVISELKCPQFSKKCPHAPRVPRAAFSSSGLTPLKIWTFLKKLYLTLPKKGPFSKQCPWPFLRGGGLQKGQISPKWR